MHTGRQRSGQVRWACGLAVLLCCAPASGGETTPAEDADAASTLVLGGSIDQAMVDRFNAAIASRDIRTVRISSHEGQAVHALEIAEGMLAGHMDVVVRGVCIGPCAAYILVAGQHRLVEDGALVAFTLSFTGLDSISELLGNDMPDGFQYGVRGIRERAASEELLYRQRGVSDSLLRDAMVALQPQCLIFRRGQDGNISGYSLSRMRYLMWVPTQRQLASAGLEIEGFWPGSRKKLVRAAEQIMEPDAQAQNLRFGDEDHLRRRRDGKYSFKALKDCVLEEAPEDQAIQQGAN